MGFFRSILNTNELSQRALTLTAIVINDNPANYTAWHYRRLCLVSLGVGVGGELEFTEEIGGENPKNYQVWYHRRALLQGVIDEDGGASKNKDVGLMELEYISRVLVEDSKNYHAWSHRQFIVKGFDLYSTESEAKELKFVGDMLMKDLRNNSAWNQRWFTVHGDKRNYSEGKVLKEDVVASEIDFTQRLIIKDGYNESSWKYLLGLVKEQWGKSEKMSEQTTTMTTSISKWVQGLISSESEAKKLSPHLLSFQIDVFDRLGFEGENKESFEIAIGYCDMLGGEVDVIREKFWSWKKGILEGKMNGGA